MASLGLARAFVEFSQNARHSFVSALSQGSDATKVSKNEWNAAHNVPDVECGQMPGLYVETVAGGTVEEYGTANRFQKRLANTSQFRIQAGVLEALAGGTLVLQYTTDLTGASGWTTMGASASVASTGNVVTSWTDVPAGAQGSSGVLLRWVIVS